MTNTEVRKEHHCPIEYRDGNVYIRAVQYSAHRWLVSPPKSEIDFEILF